MHGGHVKSSSLELRQRQGKRGKGMEFTKHPGYDEKYEERAFFGRQKKVKMMDKSHGKIFREPGMERETRRDQN